MDSGISIELQYLFYCAVLMLVLWIPSMTAEIAVTGIGKTLAYPDERTMPNWARRWKAAQYNLVENITPFAIAVFAGELLNVHTELTATCAIVFFWARVMHPFAQVLRIWGMRTIAFLAGNIASIVYIGFLVLHAT